MKKSSGISLTFSPPGPPPCIGYPSKSAEGGPISRAVSACSAPVSQRAERAKGRGRQVRTVHAVVVDRVVAHGAEASAGHGGLEHDSLDLLHNACCGTAWRDLLQLRATHSASTGHQATVSCAFRVSWIRCGLCPASIATTEFAEFARFEDAEGHCVGPAWPRPVGPQCR